MKRNLNNVVKEILTVIPSTEEGFIAELKDRLSSITFSAPELMGMWWDEVYSTLMGNLPEKPTEEWQFQVLSIFSAKTVEDIKRIFGEEE